MGGGEKGAKCGFWREMGLLDGFGGVLGGGRGAGRVAGETLRGWARNPKGFEANP